MTIPEKVLLLTDPNSDPDDLACMTVLSEMENRGFIKLCGAIASKGNFEIRERRAKFTAGALKLLGYHNIPVAVGCDYEMLLGMGDNTYCDKDEVRQLENMFPKVELKLYDAVSNILENNDNISFLVISPMAEAGWLIDNFQELAAKKIKKIIVMGGVNEQTLEPDGISHNTAVCPDGAKKLYRFALDFQIPLIVVPRETVYQVQVGHDFYDQLQENGGSLGKVMVLSNQKLLEMLWEDIHCGKYSHFDLRRFCKVFMGKDYQIKSGEIQPFEDFSDIWPKVRYFNLYDAVAALAMQEDLWLRGGYYQQLKPNQQVFVAKINDSDIIRKYLYDYIVETLVKLSLRSLSGN